MANHDFAGKATLAPRECDTCGALVRIANVLTPRGKDCGQVLYSSDHGKTWQSSEPLCTNLEAVFEASGCNCKAMLAHPDGRPTGVWGAIKDHVFIPCTHGQNAVGERVMEIERKIGELRVEQAALLDVSVDKLS